MLCLACNEINIIEKKEYYDEFTDESGEISNVIYPTKNMQVKYEHDIKQEKVYNTYIRAREADSDQGCIIIFVEKNIRNVIEKY